MPNPIRFVLALHNHQPVGNFDEVFERAYNDSYRTFLDVFSRYPSLKISLHVSGSLMEWLAGHHPDYVDRLDAQTAKACFTRLTRKLQKIVNDAAVRHPDNAAVKTHAAAVAALKKKVESR